MKILLTGNQGYIGCIMEEMFLKKGYMVVGLDAGFFQGKTFIPIQEKVRKNRQGNQIVKDIRDITEEDCAGCDAVVHLAALSNDPLGNLNPQLTEDINFKATILLAHAAKRAGVKRFVYASSCSMYGAADNAVPLDETARLNPQTPYAVSKVNSEAALQKIADNIFSPVFMRNATAFGVSPRMRFDLVLNNLCAWAWTTKEVVMVSDGKPWRPLVHIQDIAAACIAALEAPTSHIHNKAFNVGTTEENYTIREIAEKVVANFPKTQLKCLNKNSDDTRSYRISFEKIKTIGFSSMWTVDKGIEELKQAFDEYNLTKDIFEDEYFTTLKRMMALQERNEIDNDLRWKRGEK